MRRAGGQQLVLVGEVAVDGLALYTCALGHRGHRRARRPERPVQLHRRLGDAAARGLHRVGALLEPVAASGGLFDGHGCMTILTDREELRTLPQSYSPYTVV